MMKKSLVLSLLFFLLCPSTAVAENLRYHKVLILPFTRGTESLQETAYHVFKDELSKLEGLTILGKEMVTPEIIHDLDFDIPHDYGALDFIDDDRRKKLFSRFDADAVITGTVLKEAGHVGLVIGISDKRVGHRSGCTELEVLDENYFETSLIRTAELCAQSIIKFLRLQDSSHSPKFIELKPDWVPPDAQEDEGADVVYPVRNKFSNGVYCPADVKECPDGTYVSRQGPDCQFQKCPE